MIFCNCRIDGTTYDLSTTLHFRDRAEQSHVPMGLIAKLLKEGGFTVFKSVNNCLRLLIDSFEIIVDTVNQKLVTIILTNSERALVRKPKLGDLFKKRVLRRAC